MGEKVRAKAMGRDLTQGSIAKQLFLFVIPLLIGNFVQQLYNTVDVMIIGRYVGSIGTVGVSNGGEFAALMTFIATSFGSAGQIYASQLVGRKDRESVKEAANTLFTLVMGLSLVIALLGAALCGWFLRIINCPAEAMEQAKSYQLWTCLGFPAIFGYNAICGLLRGEGESKRPLLFVMIAAVANIGMDLLLVACLGMESDGTAIATVISQYAAFLASLVFMLRNKETFGISLRLRAKWKHLKVLLELGIPLTAQTAFVHVSQLYCTALINNYGLVASSANSIGSKINRLVNVFTASVSTGAGAMVGQNLGAGKLDRVVKTVYTALAGALVCSAVFSFVSLVFPYPIISLFTKDEADAQAIIQLGAAYLRIGVITLVLAAFQGAFCSVISGSGFAALNFTVGVVDSVILRIGISLFMAYVLDMGVTGFFYGNALARIGPVVIGVVYFYSGKWKTRRLLGEKKDK